MKLGITNRIWNLQEALTYSILSPSIPSQHSSKVFSAPLSNPSLITVRLTDKID